MRALEIDGITGAKFIAVLNPDEGTVMIYNPGAGLGQDPRGSRRQDMRTGDGQFVSEYATETVLREWERGHVILEGGDPEYLTITAGSARKVVKWVRCDQSGTYSTANANGMEFIGGRWVFAGDKGYRVVQDRGTYEVRSYVGGGDGRRTALSEMTRDDAHDAAWSVAYGHLYR